jgi:hypothetical protein
LRYSNGQVSEIADFQKRLNLHFMTDVVIGPIWAGQSGQFFLLFAFVSTHWFRMKVLESEDDQDKSKRANNNDLLPPGWRRLVQWRIFSTFQWKYM